MSRIPSLTQILFITTIMTSADHGSHPASMVFGQVVDEKGASVDGADVLVESAMDRRQTVSGKDGGFATDICISGFCDEVRVRALFGTMRGYEKISARSGHMTVDVVVRDMANNV